MRKLKSILVIGVLILLWGSAVYRIFMKHSTDQLTEKDFVHTKAVIINEKNYMGNSPVSHTFSYSYTFTINGNTYKNNARDPNLKIGDTIDVEYAKDRPSLNKPAHPIE